MALKNLIEFENRHRILINNLNQTGIGVDIVDVDYNVIYNNEVLSDKFGVNQGLKCYEYYLGLNSPCENCPMKRALRNIAIEKEIKSTPDNRTYEIISAPLPNHDGTLDRVVEIVIDITEKRKYEQRLQESEDIFRMIADQSSIGIGIIQDNIVKYVNTKVGEMFGYDTDDIINWGPLEFLNSVHPEYRILIADQVQKKQAGKRDYFLDQYQFKGIKKSGESFWMENFTKSIVYKGKPADLVMIVDITEKKKAELELIKLNNLKSEFLTRTSHELKTPTMLIKGYTELFLEKFGKTLGVEELTIITEIEKASLRLETLIHDILQEAEFESGKGEINKHRNDLSFLIHSCVRELKEFAEFRDLTINLNIHEELIIQFDRNQMYQVINNILSNAIKYTEPLGVIEINSKIAEDSIEIAIQDSGIGFTEEEKERLFTQFGKIERYGQGFDIITEGAGLGLHIAKKIIDLHGGEIWVESEGKNKGSIFHFSLPKHSN